jgi:hypothetical protein
MQHLADCVWIIGYRADGGHDLGASHNEAASRPY